MIKLKPASFLLLLSLTAFFLSSSLHAHAVKMVDVTLSGNGDPMYADLETRHEQNGVVYMKTTAYARKDFTGPIDGVAVVWIGFNCQTTDMYTSDGIINYNMKKEITVNKPHTKYSKTINFRALDAPEKKFVDGFCNYAQSITPVSTH